MAKCGECRFFSGKVCNVNNANREASSSACNTDFANNNGSNEKFCKNCRFFSLIRENDNLSSRLIESKCKINNANRSPSSRGCADFSPFMANQTELSQINEERSLNNEKVNSISDKKQVNNNIKKNKSSDLSLEKLNNVAENVKRWHDTENEMIQNYLLNNKDKKIVENIKSKNNLGLLLKSIFSIFFIISSYIVLQIINKFFLIFIIILIWVILFKYINHKILNIKRKIASSEMPNGRIDTDDIVIGKISIWDHKILDYLSSPEGKEWIKNIYNK